ncbi:hypothetical protein BESB_048990 [Besnoitia besnoiti]|uniref:Uncharacterized protein n=1 Tax=Besnoitia besnoiti TaxID=94643 RepID=A0A2A9MLX1_BESBE|nr:hypothetical protein BESB_048990 [Besnoitia besnoiti]PFH36707.1 hypothetical protein BESB_048990 [Besnoitia besnoiti]
MTSSAVTIALVVTVAQHSLEADATSTSLLDKRLAAGILASVPSGYGSRPPPRGRAKSGAGTLLPALSERPLRLQRSLDYSSRPSPTVLAEAAAIKLHNHSNEAVRPPVTAHTREPADAGHWDAYDYALAEAVEAVIDAKNTRKDEDRRSYEVSSAFSNFSKLPQRSGAAAQAAISELTLAPVHGRRELLQLFLEDAPGLPQETWREILLFRLEKLRALKQDDARPTSAHTSSSLSDLVES